jgi:hypothetical protein
LQFEKNQRSFGYPTLDSTGNLWVLCNSYVYCEYAAGGKDVVQQKVTRWLRLQKFGIGGSIAADSSGDIAVQSATEIWVFAPGQTQAYWKITLPQPYQTAMAFDKNGDLYVSGRSTGLTSSVYVYPPNATQPSEVLNNANGSPALSLAFDSAQNLYVLTSACGRSCDQTTVSVYGQGATEPTYAIQKGLQSTDGIAMAVNSLGGVYVAGYSYTNDVGNLVVYAPQKQKPQRTVSQDSIVMTVVTVSP